MQPAGVFQTYSTPLHQPNMRNSVQKINQTCHCRPKKTQSTNYGRWISIFTKQEYTHSPDCPQFARADYARSVAAQFTVFNRIVGLCIQAGWQNSRSDGWTTIAPILRYRAVVARNSGAFKIFDDAIRNILRNSGSSKSYDDILLTVSSVLQRSFAEVARPDDVDENGNGIMQVCFLV
jgi:hypothetical protein